MRRWQESERGSIIIVVLLVSLTLMALGLAASQQARTTSRVQTAVSGQQQARYAADSGMARALVAVRSTLDFNALLDGIACTSTPKLHAKYGVILCDPFNGERYEARPVVPQHALAAAHTPNYNGWLRALTYTVYIRNDEMEYQECSSCTGGGVCANLPSTKPFPQCRFFADQNSIVTLVAIGTAPSGQTSLIELTVQRPDPTPPGSTYSQKGVNGQGNSSGTINYESFTYQ